MKKILSFLMIIIILGGIGVGVYFIVFKGSNKKINFTALHMYVAAIKHQIKLKDVEFLETEESIARGTKVLVYDKEITKSEEDKTIFKKIYGRWPI